MLIILSKEQKKYLLEIKSEFTTESQEFITDIQEDEEIEIQYDIAEEIVDVCAENEAFIEIENKELNIPASIVTLITNNSEW